jgi:hypothetical protein
LTDALRVHALINIRQHQWTEAAHALEEGLTVAQRTPYPFAEARLRCVKATMHILLGERGSAREPLESAAAIFGRLGARWHLEQTERMITTL